MKKAVVTGATKGMGRAISLALAKEGYDLALAARSEADLQDLSIELLRIHPAGKFILKACDLSETNAVKDFGDLINKEWPQTDVLVNNFGTFIPGKIWEEQEGTLEKMMDTNLYCAYYLTRALVGNMIIARKGHIFNICSSASIHPAPNAGSYTASKFALLGLTKSLREEVKKYNIKVTAIIPGSTFTNSWKGTTIAQENFIQSEDIALAVIEALKFSKSAVVDEIIINPMESI